MLGGMRTLEDAGLQGSLFGGGEPAVGAPLPDCRVDLDHGAWIVRVPGWISGEQTLLDELADRTTWHAGRRPMYDRIVDVPRLTTRRWDDHPAVLDQMARALSRRYGVGLPSISANLYRDGRDSVAWHGDQIGRHRADAVVAILSLGATRKLLLRPEGGGPSTGFALHAGDLLVQGGTCQRTFQHCVPKQAEAGPRISVMFRQAGGH